MAALADLKLALRSRLALNSHRFSPLCILSAGTRGVRLSRLAKILIFPKFNMSRSKSILNNIVSLMGYFCLICIGSVFQFGSSTTNFNFTNNNPSGVFTFGANPSTPAASAQPSGSGGFPFSQSPASFTLG